MFILLLTLLCIALIMTFAGLFLSSKRQESQKQEITYVGRDASIRRGRGRSYVVRSAMLRGETAVIPTRGKRLSYEVGRRPFIAALPSFNMSEVFGTRLGKQNPWLGVILILLALFGFSFFTLQTFMANPGLVFNMSLPDSVVATPTTAAKKPSNSSTSLFSSLSGASKALVRVSQLDPAQYASTQEYNTWSYSACSTASMTEVINAYGHHYRITDILKVESGIGEITPELGLLEPHGIDKTVAHFGFKTVWLNNTNIDQVIQVANQGRPVIVSFPPSRWDGGHLLVVRGGNSQSVYLADSSKLNMQVMSRPTFLKYWGGMAVVVVPN